MTFKLGKNEVHIGLWETGIIIVGIISCTWGVSALNNSYNNREEKRSTEQHLMFQKINWIARQDTVMIGYRKSNDSMLSILVRKQTIFEALLQKSKAPVLKFVTEQYDKNGLHFNEVTRK